MLAIIYSSYVTRYIKYLYLSVHKTCLRWYFYNCLL